MANRLVYRGPKRRIEKVLSRIDHTITNSVTEVVLHTAEDRKTLVRTIVQLDVHLDQKTGSSTFSLKLQRAPRGTTIINPSIGESTDIDMAKEEIWSYTGFVDSVEKSPTFIMVDLKGMRKLDPGDTLVLSDFGGNLTATMVGTIILIFKE